MAASPAEPGVAIVTGANSGIGLEVAAGLRAAGHHVVMACRSLERCTAAKADLDRRPELPGSCECRQLDLSDFASVRRFAEELQARPPAAGPARQQQAPLAAASKPAAPRRLQIVRLVNNAGVMGSMPDHMQPNHFGPYLLTRLLLPLMAPASRIVTVASEAHRRGSLRVRRDPGSARLQLGKAPGWWYAAYAQSKLANVLMMAELSRRLQQRRSSVTAYSVSPGRVNTGIFKNVPGLLQPALRWLAGAWFQIPAQGARTVLHAALAPELAGRHELYLHNSRPSCPSSAAQDERLAADLWQLSNQHVGLSAADDAALWPPH